MDIYPQDLGREHYRQVLHQRSDHDPAQDTDRVPSPLQRAWALGSGVNEPVVRAAQPAFPQAALGGPHPGAPRAGAAELLEAARGEPDAVVAASLNRQAQTLQVYEDSLALFWTLTARNQDLRREIARQIQVLHSRLGVSQAPPPRRRVSALSRRVRSLR